MENEIRKFNFGISEVKIHTKEMKIQFMEKKDYLKKKA
jgi:hypothetical protein